MSRLFAEGESGFVYPIRYVWCERVGKGESVGEGSDPTATLFTVPKRFHKRANRRNLLRRRMKEAFRLQKAPIVSAGLNISLIYSTKETLDYDRILKSVTKVIEQIMEAQKA